MAGPRKMLSDWNAPYIQSLVRQIETQAKPTLARWAIEECERCLVPIWNRHHPEDLRPQDALKAARDWMSGAVKLPEARRRILGCHAAAREAGAHPAAQAAARAIGQSASTIHAPRHCIGLALYGSLAVAYHALGTKAAWEQLEARAAEECARMLAALRAVSVEDEPNPARIDWKC